jgi:hypothetical protein
VSGLQRTIEQALSALSAVTSATGPSGPDLRRRDPDYTEHTGSVTDTGAEAPGLSERLALDRCEC